MLSCEQPCELQVFNIPLPENRCAIVEIQKYLVADEPLMLQVVNEEKRTETTENRLFMTFISESDRTNKLGCIHV